MFTPTPNQFNHLWQFSSNNISSGIVGIFNPNFLCTSIYCSFTGCFNFIGHLFGKLLIIRFCFFSFIPMSNTGYPFNISTNINFHNSSPLEINFRLILLFYTDDIIPSFLKNNFIIILDLLVTTGL